MRRNKYTTLEKIGLTLLITGLLLAIITILIAAFITNVALGTIILGLLMAIVGIIILRE